MTRPQVDSTHDVARRSWVTSANQAESDFPIQNLPLGCFCPRGASTSRVGVAIGDQVLDLWAGARAGLLSGLPAELEAAAQAPDLGALMALGRPAWSALRARVGECLDAHSPARPEWLHPQADVELLLPAQVGDYTDFYASLHHATNVGRLFRPDNPLLPNYKHVPIGYHGRASSLVTSGTPVRRPRGQRRPPDAEQPLFGPSTLLDYELELGAFIGPGNALGTPIALERAEEHIFGLCLVNDWSARDIQAWEYQPLGPFLAKSFATSVSPWVVTLEALAPFRAPQAARAADDPAPLPYLHAPGDAAAGGFDIVLEVWLRSARQRDAGATGQRLSRASFLDMYWTLGQMLTHHASNGCNLRPGDLLASGTVSGPQADARGCLLELTRRGAEPVALSDGESRRFLEDGDEVRLVASCARPGYARIGFGACVGVVLPALGD
jgi:fumarylacetoacetase